MPRKHAPRARRFTFSRRKVLFAVIFGIIGLALILRIAAAPNPNLTGDLNNDNKVNVSDLSVLMTNWNKTTDAADINKDGKTNITDLSILLSNWGKTPTTPNPPGPGPNPPNPPGPGPNPPNPNPAPNYTCNQAGIQQLVNSVSQANVEANLRALVQDDTKPTPNQSVSRHITGPGNKQKTTWMKQKLAGYGLTDRSQTFNADGVTGLVNPVGRINGTAATNLYGVGAHIDSQSEKPSTLAPGADDDGSGVAAVIEAARVLYDFRSCLKATVDFVGFNDEEESMKGSVEYINKIDKTFKGMFNMDMIATHQNGTDCIENAYNSSRDRFMADKLQEVNTKYTIGMTAKLVTYNSDDVDSARFWQKSLPSSYSAECKFSPNYHSTKDVIDSSISFTQITKMTRMIVASVAELGMQ